MNGGWWPEGGAEKGVGGVLRGCGPPRFIEEAAREGVMGSKPGGGRFWWRKTGTRKAKYLLGDTGTSSTFPASQQHPYPAALLELTEPPLGLLLLPGRHLHLQEERWP